MYDLFAYPRVARGVCAHLFARGTAYSSRVSVYLPSISITLSEKTGRVHVRGRNTEVLTGVSRVLRELLTDRRRRPD